MLEILFLVYLCKQIGKILRDKGRSPGWFQFLLVVLWLGGEFFGAVVASVLGVGEAGGVYLGALLGAAGGAVLGFVIAKSVAPASALQPPAFEVLQRGRPAGLPDSSEL